MCINPIEFPLYMGERFGLSSTYEKVGEAFCYDIPYQSAVDLPRLL